MDFIKTAVRRRVTISMIYTLVALLGFIAWQKLPQEFMPSLAFPQLMVVTSYPNASSQEIENLVTKVVEEAGGTVKGVRRLHSISKEGVSVVTVEFQWGVNMDFASLNLREKIDLVKIKLPREAKEPRIERFNPFELPVVVLSLSGKRTPQELLKIAKRPVAELLEKIPGVAVVSLTGGLEREILVELDQSRLAAHHLPILDVVEAVKKGNITYPAGNIKDAVYEYVVRIAGAINKPGELEDVIVHIDREKRLLSSSRQRDVKKTGQTANQQSAKYGGAQAIRVGALGKVKDTYKEKTSFSRYDSQENISLSILKQGDANIVAVAERVKKRLPDINSKLPVGVKLDLIYDQSTFIKTGIRQMIQAGVMGAFLAFLVLYIFLGSYRQALIVSTAIPTSILATLFLLNLKGITLNTVSLAGLAVGIGLLVDGAIVVIENITRHREKGQGKIAAAIIGSQEVFGAVASSIGTTVVVFLPLIFVLGIIGQVFKDLSWAIVFSQIASLFVAFTLIPMLAGVWSTAVKERKKWQQPLVNLAGKSKDGLNKFLSGALEHPGKVLLASLIVFGLSITLMTFLPKGLFPKIDQDEFVIHLTMPIGSKLETTNQACLEIEKELQQLREVEHRLVSVGSLPLEGLQPLGTNEAKIVVTLKSKRKRNADEIREELKAQFASLDLKGGRINFKTQGSGLGALAGSSDPVMVEIKGYDLKETKVINDQVIAALEEITGLTNIKSTLSLNAPEIGIRIKRDQAASYSLSVADLAKTLLAAIRGSLASKYREAGKEIDIRVQLQESQRNSNEALRRLMVRSPLELTVPLEAVADIESSLGPSEIYHIDQQRTVVVSAGLFKKNLDDIKPQIKQALADIKQEHPDFTLDLTGEAVQVQESFVSLRNILILSLLLVFMIMAALFESLWQPFLILFTIPLAMIGMAPALLITGHSLSAMAGMGLVLLSGIVVNNGIVLIDFVNQRRKEEKITLKAALLEACNIRMRPIVMTAATTILGLLPLAIGFSKGTQMQAPMAVVVVSGLLVSTMLTLIILPVMVIFVEERIMKKRKRIKA
ncbi:efflux RND transporter permease subunit [bacterium]|nr:efflux RND transporter permease subunit [bacterium]